MKHLQNVRYTIAAVAAVAALGLTADAKAQTQNVTADVTVQNTLNLAQVSGLNFGTIAALRHATNTASVALSTAGVLGTPATTGAGAAIAVIDNTAADNAEISVEDGAPGAAINVNIPIAGIVQPIFGGNSLALGTWRYAFNALPEAGITPGTPVVVNFDATYAAGVNSFRVGATLSTTTGAVAYADGAYAGSFDVTFSY